MRNNSYFILGNINEYHGDKKQISREEAMFELAYQIINDKEHPTKCAFSRGLANVNHAKYFNDNDKRKKDAGSRKDFN